MTTFSAGADPEIFLVDAAGAFVSSIGKIGGSKQEPLPLPIGEGYAVQEDNVAIEFNIPAADSREMFINNIKLARDFLSTEVHKMGLAFSKNSAALFPMHQLLDPAAREFGCDPDFNAWEKGAVNNKPDAPDKTLRSAGGHVHVGYKFRSKKQAFQFIQYMDCFLGIPSVIMDDGDMRKQLYGKAGACRIKPYGVEYRTLSNFWIFDERLIGWVWDQTAAAMDAWQNGVALDETIPLIINNNDKAAAAAMVDRYALALV